MSSLAERYFSLRTVLPSWTLLPFFPADTLDYPDGSLLDRLYLTTLSSDATETEVSAELGVAWESTAETVFPLLGVSGLSLVVGAGEAMELTLAATFSESSFAFALTTDFSLRFDASLVRPVVLVGGEYQPVADGVYEVAFIGTTVTLDSAGGIAVLGAEAVVLAPFMIGDTGVVVDAGTVTLCLSADAAAELATTQPDASLDETFRGVFIPAATAYFPDTFPVESLALRNALIGTHGFSGTLSFQPGDDRSTIVERGTCFGFAFTLESLALTFVQNALTGGAIAGRLAVPFFDEEVDVALSLGTDGSLYVALADPGGLVTISKPGLGVLELTGLGLVSDEQGTGLLLSGSLRLEVGAPALKWPAVSVQGLRIGPGGEVAIPGGWIDFQEPLALDLYGFGMEISRIGFGKEDDGRRWVGLSGGVSLADFLPTGVSVEGLRVLWDPTDRTPDPEIRLQGIGLTLTIPGVLSLDGDVALLEDNGAHVFRGNARLELSSLGVGLDVSLMLGRDAAEHYGFLYVFLGVELPVGIPLWATGAALYGLQGLYGSNVTTRVDEHDHDWYAWYRADPAFNVSDSNKWKGEKGALAVGAGLVIGTIFDAGYVVSTKSLLVLLLPGPVIMFQGRADILSVRPGLTDGSEGTLGMLMVLDAAAALMQLNIDANWSLPKILSLTASSEAYFDMARPHRWHLYIGQDKPEDRRIRADLLTLFHGDAYLMMDRGGIATGGGVSFGDRWKFTPVTVTLKAWLEAAAGIAWRPPQLKGRVSLGGEVGIAVAVFEVGLAVEATLSAKAPRPFHVLGTLSVRVKLPVPLKDLEEAIRLEWKQDIAPLLEDPLDAIALIHQKVTETWPIPSASITPTGVARPRLDTGGPVVPLDARPAIIFDRAVKDLTGIADTNIQYPGSTVVGDYLLDYELTEVALEYWPKGHGSAWTAVSSEDLYGAWQATEDGEGNLASATLELWTQTPFAFTRNATRTYRDAFLQAHPNWPCGDGLSVSQTCVTWQGVPFREELGPLFTREGLTFLCPQTVTMDLAARVTPCRGRDDPAICFQPVLWILFPEPVRSVELCLEGSVVYVRGHGGGEMLAEVRSPADGRVVVEAAGIEWVEVNGDNVYLSEVCYATEAETTAAEWETLTQERREASLTSWASAEEILRPETYYRLKVVTRSAHSGGDDETFTHYTHFQTGGPSGLVREDFLPPAAEDAAATYPRGGQLTTLGPYVQHTIPPEGSPAVYRGYDLGVAFNENYVEQMYGADMAIRLRDANGRPATDAEGSELVLRNRWADNPLTQLDSTEFPYLTRAATCAGSSTVGLTPDRQVNTRPDLLFYDDFSSGLTRWTDTGVGVPVLSPVPHRELLPVVVNPLAPHLMVAGDEGWADLAVEAHLTGDGSHRRIDLFVRHRAADGRATHSYYQLTLTPAGKSFTRVIGAERMVLWADDAPYVDGSGAAVAVHCRGNRLRAQLDDDLLFDLRDEEPLATGNVGIVDGHEGAFTEILVRAWPGVVLAPRTLYSAELVASYVLFYDDFGWQPAGWTVLDNPSADGAIAVTGDELTDSRAEVDFDAVDGRIGLVVRCSIDGADLDCYRLHLNRGEAEIRLVRLRATCDVRAGTFSPDDTTPLWIYSPVDTAEVVDFALDHYSLALTSVADRLTVEVNGVVMAEVTDPTPIARGQSGVHYRGVETPVFSDYVVRSAPANTAVHTWNFTTSSYEGLVEHMDSYQGAVYPAAGEMDGFALDGAAFSTALSAAWSDVEPLRVLVTQARVAQRTASPADMAAAAGAVAAAVPALSRAAGDHFDALYDLCFASVYRALPPVVELIDVRDHSGCHAVLLESPQPVDWTSIELRLRDASGADFSDLAWIWSEDGTRAFVAPSDGRRLPDGDYSLDVVYIVSDNPLLSRAGSTLPEVARLSVPLAAVV